MAINYVNRPDAAAEVQEAVRALGREGFPVQADVAVAADVARMMAQVLGHLGHTKPLEPERRLGTTSLLQNKAVKDLRPGSLRSIDTTTNSVEQILLRCLTHHGRYMLVGKGGSEGCQGPRGCRHGTSSSVPVDKVLQWLWKDFLPAFQIFKNSQVNFFQYLANLLKL